MPVANVPLLAFNRGIVSKLALARTDIARIALSAEVMTNYIPRVLGPMSLRPGWGYLGSSHNDAAARYLPFIFSTDDLALVEVSDSLMRVWVNDAVVTRPSVTTAVTNGSFDTDVTGWTDADESGATSQWRTGGYLDLTGNGTAAAIRRQQVTVSGGNLNVEHALDIRIERGPVTLRVGSTSGGDEYITETSLDKGMHSLAFTPGGDFHIQFSSRLKRRVLVASCNVAGSGAMQVDAPWVAADLDKLRIDQSGDILFVACDGYQQRKIERRGTRSWSLVRYYADDGPFDFENEGPVTITPSALSGNVTLTASSALFRSSHVESTWRITSSGQRVQQTVTAQNTFSNAILVTGVDSQRVFTIIRSGTWSATVTLQRSLEEEGSWEDVTTYTTNATITFDDGLDNQIAYYRIGVKTGGFTSGTINLELRIATGSVDGVARITEYTSPTSVSAEILTDLGDTVATSLWAEGQWSDRRGWPTSVALHEGRLWWAGRDSVWGSVSDSFYSMDASTEGDSGPIDRSIGSGPVDTINWLLSLQRLMVGAEGAEFAARSSSFDEPLTPTAFALREASTQGSAAVAAVKIDKTGIYVQKSGTKVFLLNFDTDQGEYGSGDLTLLAPQIGEPGISRLAVQRQPDTRIHCVRSDGTVALLVFDVAENVRAWVEIETDGLIEDAVVLPGDVEDSVYYLVRRTINGGTKRYLEKWALTSQCLGETLNRQADAFTVFTNSGGSTTTVTGLSHLEAESVCVWANGKDLGNYTVSGGQITVSEAIANGASAVVGLEYTAQFKSTKLAYASGAGSALTQKKRVARLGLLLADTHYQGVEFGQSFDRLDPLPGYEDGAAVAANTVHSVYDEQSIPVPGTWDTDARLCLQSQAPRPATILAAIVTVDEHDRV